MIFKTSLDKTAVGITVFITALFACIIGVVYVSAASQSLILTTTIMLLALYCLAFAFHPTAYKIVSNELIICRPVWNVHIKRATIKSMAIMDQSQIVETVRTFGVGGVFGYYGCFANYTLGSMTWYATRKDSAVLINTVDNKRIVVTPNEPEQFVAALNG